VVVTLELKKQSQQKACQVDRILHEISNSTPFSTIAAATGLPSIRIFACKKCTLHNDLWHMKKEL